ncbi:uncharacterized protein BX663DRAFT_577093 [Cokeromyces recurvatus]|uniref:uncharacterized protein n=1 Tax=Cokeromyces recurvatus TaxID=90255 RepID=UPI00221F48C1|nr:uncharacterized protein BX663DRAFT_577093 [Cokeromyces recurvatus]KAI7906284.1 hypothetical protein BX663DRAFT_577093 [Cokeromyces recurvatus]
MAMHFTRDEQDRRRIPIFLKNITIKVSKAPTTTDDKSRIKKKLHGGTVFKITVQYGNLSWIVYRRYWDFVKLHYIYKTLSSRTPQFPSIPKYRFQNRQRNLQNFEEEQKKGSQQQCTMLEPVVDEDTIMALASSVNDTPATNSSFHLFLDADHKVLKDMEDYMNQFISSIGPCGHINRLCVQLSSRFPNIGYHGKEGYAVFQSRTDRDPKQKRMLLHDGLSLFTTGSKRRHKPKWFIVRESYIVCVDDPSESKIYDVFLFDQNFDIHRLILFGKHHKGKFSSTLVNASHWASKKSTLCLTNIHGVYHLRTKNEQQARQFEKSIQSVSQNSIWCKPNRFDSFAPIRHNIPLTWYVDGRDYLWDISVALENAKECIYIHDWWLSPELVSNFPTFLRRPAAQNHEWRLDRILKRKADQGVKIYIIIYKEVAMALPLFSHTAKRHLLSLSSNIFVQRHPSRAIDIFKKDNIFFWAHHEKICVIDNEIAFLGGIDQCFGRWDTPAHILIDDLPANEQIWPGKDYSNPRIIDFHTLDKPFEDNQDRTTLPRMPWHDISMRLMGHSARDAARHFIQRWNYLRRKKPLAPRRPTPMLLPVPDHDGILKIDHYAWRPHMAQCSVQILRSVSPWSIGSTKYLEHSIQNAYFESIRNSEHFIYIGDAIYERIVRAHREGKKWRAILVLPLMPGFPANIDETEATAVRLISEYQYLTIGRGPDSLLARLHAAGIHNTHEYINFYGLRNWAELNGEFVTEQIYIHSKTMIVDDRIVIIGSANINERSLLGTRDSEIAAYIEDTDLMDSVLDGKSIKVGRFAHTLRMRLMCEHVGLDIDEIDIQKYSQNSFIEHHFISKNGVNCIPPYIQVMSTIDQEKQQQQQNRQEEYDLDQASEFSDSSSSSSNIKKKQELGQVIINRMAGDKSRQLSESSAEPLHREETTSTTKTFFGKRRSLAREDYIDFWNELDPDTDNNGDGITCNNEQLKVFNFNQDTIYKILQDPLHDNFQNFWHMLARVNTDLFRRSFLVMPDNNVKTWAQYDNYIKMAKLFLGRIDIKHGGTKTTAAAATTVPFCGLMEDEVSIREILGHIKGHLVIWPTHFMEEDNDNILTTVDRIAPIEIFV